MVSALAFAVLGFDCYAYTRPQKLHDWGSTHNIQTKTTVVLPPRIELPYPFTSFCFPKSSAASCIQAHNRRLLATVGVIAIAIAIIVAEALMRAIPTTEMATTAGRGRVLQTQTITLPSHSAMARFFGVLVVVDGAEIWLTWLFSSLAAKILRILQEI